MTRPAYWQPMHTAPRDGTVVDLSLKGGGRMTDQWWDEEDSSWCGLEDDLFDAWAPLPATPIKPPPSDFPLFPFALAALAVALMVAFVTISVIR